VEELTKEPMRLESYMNWLTAREALISSMMW